jgi:hypothetical protein
LDDAFGQGFTEVLTFYGFDIELVVDSVLDRRSDDPVLCSATDLTGQRWLIMEADCRDDNVHSWVCAPASRRVVELVASGRAAPADALLHSLTGWVEVVAVVDGHSVPDRRVPCSQLASSGLLAAV